MMERLYSLNFTINTEDEPTTEELIERVRQIIDGETEDVGTFEDWS